MKFILISPKNRTAYNFRGDLIKDIISAGYEVVVTGPNKDNIEHILKLGARFEEVPLDRSGLNILNDLKYLKKLYQLIKKEQPDVTLGYTIKPVIYGSLAARFAGVSNIYSMITGKGYVYASNDFKAKILKFFISFLYKISFKGNKQVIFQNKDDRDEFVELGIIETAKTSIVNGSGVNMNRFKPVGYPETLTFFMLSRVLYNKGIREYLEAAKNIKEKYPHVKFNLLGAVENIEDSMKMKELQPYIDNNIITYFGETHDVREYFSKSSVFVLPSYAGEGTPRTILEAMAMARPILTTDVPGCRETVREGKNGFLIEPRSIKELEEKMEWFVHNHEKIPEMGYESLEYCQTKFEISKVNSDMMTYMNL